jgi:septum site-determining protein MinC
VHNRKNNYTPVIPLQIRSRTFIAIVLRLTAQGETAFLQALEEKLQQAPNFFRGAPVVLDLEEIAKGRKSMDFLQIVDALRDRAMMVMGVQNGNAGLNEEAISAGLAVLKGGRDVADNRQGRVPQVEFSHQSSVLITEPVRSGQRALAVHGDLIITASVSSGAELIAEGNIHVYGVLRGRALAGANGNTQARIFCGRLEAELIAIAGLYKVSDDIDSAFLGQPVQAFLDAETLLIEVLR